jgi:photosystem II stability/assembly factor-like uncharacterized protein
MFDSSCRLYLGTEDGLRTLRADDSGVTEVASGLDGNAVRAIDVSPEDSDNVFVGCGLRGWGLHRTTDGGESFESVGFEDEWVWGVRRHPANPATVYVGTEPPMLYRSTDDGDRFRALESIEDVPSRDEWEFFHEPFDDGHVHGIALHPDRPERIVAGVENGPLVRSTDGGHTWTDWTDMADVHRVTVHPEDPDRLFAGTGYGLYTSEDGGADWVVVPDLDGEYIHAIEFSPQDPDRMYAYASDERMPLYRSTDGGKSWTGIDEGLPAARAADTLRVHPGNPDVLFYAGGEEEGRLFVSPDAGDSWEELDSSLPKPWRLAVVSDDG